MKPPHRRQKNGDKDEGEREKGRNVDINLRSYVCTHTIAFPSLKSNFEQGCFRRTSTPFSSKYLCKASGKLPSPPLREYMLHFSADARLTRGQAEEGMGSKEK